MLLTILIVLFSLVALTAIHEAGHFLLAKKFGVKVEEFGIGYPPKICGKKFGKTIYSLNLLPFGAFVRILGEEEASDSQESFSSKPIWQRALILLGGVVSFWLVAFLIFTLIIGLGGVPTAISDDFSPRENIAAYVQILQVSPDSPASAAGLKPGDIINKLKVNPVKLPLAEFNGVKKETPKESFAIVQDPTGQELKVEEIDISKVNQVQNFVANYNGQEVVVSLQRGEKNLEVILIPRVNPPQGEGAMGVALARVANLKYPWYRAPFQAAKLTFQQTKNIPLALSEAIKKKIQGSKDSGLQFVGPIGIGQIMGQAMHQGWGNYLMLIAMISIWMALFNILPVPALDGGRLLFLVVEFIKREPINRKIEQRITAVFFFLMVALMALVSIKDIIRLF